MGWIDVAIPGVIGLLLVAFPGQFGKPTGDPEKDAGKVAKLRTSGVILLVVAAGYFLIKMVSGR